MRGMRQRVRGTRGGRGVKEGLSMSSEITTAHTELGRVIGGGSFSGWWRLLFVASSLLKKCPATSAESHTWATFFYDIFGLRKVFCVQDKIEPLNWSMLFDMGSLCFQDHSTFVH